MGCWEHNRDFVGKCTWCGKPLCVICIAKEDGKKIYCRKCLGSLSEIKPFEKPKPLVKEIKEDTLPKKTIRKISPEAYELDKGYILKKPKPVDKPKPIERRLPLERREKSSGASKHAMNFLEMQQIFDKIETKQTKLIQEQQEPQKPQQPQLQPRPQQPKQPRPTPSFMGRVNESTSKKAAQSALQFLAKQARETGEKAKK